MTSVQQHCSLSDLYDQDARSQVGLLILYSSFMKTIDEIKLALFLTFLGSLLMFCNKLSLYNNKCRSGIVPHELRFRNPVTVKLICGISECNTFSFH